MLTTIFQCAALIFTFMTGGFIVSILKRDNTVADIFWGLGFVLIAWFTLVKTGLFLPRQLIATGLVTLWGARLAGYISIRHWGKKEDARYTQLAAQWGTRYFYLHTFIKIFMLQGFLLLVIASSIIVINTSLVDGLGIREIIATLLWVIGFFFEAVGDWQLYSFIKRPENRNKIMDQGLWSITRHPNYFGEVLMWWALWLLAVSLPYGLIAVISPLTITCLLLFISGIPLAEKQLEQIPGFEDYKKKTSIFFPWPAK